jgi:hypothetical protein
MDVIIQKGNYTYTTSKVQETNTPDTQWVHFLYLDSYSLRSSGESKAVGQQISVEFDARVLDEDASGPGNITRVYELDENGLPRNTHYLYLDSSAITSTVSTVSLPVPARDPVTGRFVGADAKLAPGPAPAELEKFAKGTKIRVNLTATVGERPQPDLFATNKVTEINARTHFLYLGSKSVTGEKTPGGTVRAQFDAEVVGDYKDSRTLTTRVRELTEDNIIGFTHYLYLNSPSITIVTEPEQPAAPEQPVAPEQPAITFAEGTKIRVNLTAIAGERPREALNTNMVDEASGFTHYLFLASDKVTGNKDVGKTIQATFNGEVAGRYEAGPGSTTLVRELRTKKESGNYGYTHYVLLNSPSVTLLTRKPARKSAAAKGSTVSIDQYDTTIDDTQVDNRIDELEGEIGYNVVRLRNGEVLATFGDEEDAEAYIRDEDYDRARVDVQEQELGEDDRWELDNLRELRDTLGISNSYTLYNESYFDADWAREQAQDELNVSSSVLDEWPLDQLDWDDAARERRDARYPEDIVFDGASFYYAS